MTATAILRQTRVGANMGGVRWMRRRSATLDDVVELLQGLGFILMRSTPSSKRSSCISKEKTMAKPSPEDRERRRRLIEEGREARRQMQETLDRVGARQEERRARRERSLFRRLFAR